MARLCRMKYSHPDEGFYHIMSRTVMKSYRLLQENEKDQFLAILHKLTKTYFVKVATFSIMSTHFHLIVQMIHQGEFSDEEIEERFHLYYDNHLKPPSHRRPFRREDIPTYRRRWGDVSIFVQDLKQRFSRWFNSVLDNHGHVWSERFKSVLLQSDRALLACMIYVELNSVRAGMVKRPEDYGYCGYHYLVKKGFYRSLLDFTILTDLLDERPLVEDRLSPGYQPGVPFLSKSQILVRYGELIYEYGGLAQEGQSGFEKVKQPLFLKSIKHFSNGLVLGTKEFCQEKYREFRSYFQGPREKKAQAIITLKKEQEKNLAGVGAEELCQIHSLRRYQIE